jgi:hypothetical protein
MRPLNEGRDGLEQTADAPDVWIDVSEWVPVNSFLLPHSSVSLEIPGHKQAKH